MTAVNDSERHEIEQLLPWHAAGTLSRSDAQRIEAALAGDAELARRYALVREELGHTIQLNETLGAPSARVLDQLFAKIDAEPARRGSAVQLGFRGRMNDFFATMSPRALSFAAAAAVIVILLQAGFIASVLVKSPGTGFFETASMSGGKAEGAYALLRFQPETSAADITAFLDSNRLSITRGPFAGGLYEVKLAPAALPKDELTDLIKKLQGDRIVGFIAASD